VRQPPALHSAGRRFLSISLPELLLKLLSGASVVPRIYFAGCPYARKRGVGRSSESKTGQERDLGMRKYTCVRLTLFLILLAVFVGAFFKDIAQAKQRQSSSKKAKAATGKRSSKRSVASAKSAVRGRSGKSARKARVARRSGKASKSRAEQAISLGRRGKMSKSERRSLSRLSRRRRAQAIYLARLRAVRARDGALRNIAASNIAKDDSAGEDLDVRSAAITALQGRSGTVVVMDPNTGRVYTIVNQQMALGSPVKPCSTVKLIVGLASLHEGIFDPNEDVQISSRASMNLTDALARSNNPVFQVLGRMLGYERVMQYAANFGFGERTGVNYPGESQGFLPEEGDQETGHMSSHGDGFGITAVQLAAFTAAIANGGNLYIPRIPRTPEEAEDFRPILRRRIEMSLEDRMRLMAGMIGAVNYGTGKLSYNPIAQVAGKTGTCTGSRDRLGLFTSFSSVDNPRLIVTVITTGSTEAGKRAAEIAGRIYNMVSPRFFRDRLMTPAAGAELEINNPRK
jgi:Penicillin binding protein transpeptidase domain